jgi:hypothetical protein
MTAPAPGSRLGALAGPAYFVGGLCVLVSILDYAGAVWPAAPADVQWRYGAVGLLSGFTLTPLLGSLVLLATAGLARHRGALRGVGATSMVAAIALLVLLAAFGLDAVQVSRDAASPEQRTVAALGATRAGIKLLATAAALFWLGWAGLRQARRS